MNYVCPCTENGAYAHAMIDGVPSAQFCKLAGPEICRPNGSIRPTHCMDYEGYKTCQRILSRGEDPNSPDFEKSVARNFVVR